MTDSGSAVQWVNLRNLHVHCNKHRHSYTDHPADDTKSVSVPVNADYEIQTRRTRPAVKINCIIIIIIV